MKYLVGITLLFSLVMMSGCGGSETEVVNQTDTPNPAQQQWTWQLPATFPTPKVPKDNPMSADKVELGRYLFYDKRLSVNGQTSCSSCHEQRFAFTDALPRSIGATGELHPRSSLSLVNVAYLPTLNWANPAVTRLEDQLLTPLFGEHPIEMGLTDSKFKDVQLTLSQDARYQQMFAKAFDRPFTAPSDYGLVEISQAIASFERSIISADSKYDRSLRGLDSLSASEQRGKQLFFSEKAECFHCHGSFNFNDQVVTTTTRVLNTPFHNTGLYNIGDGNYPEDNQGLYDVTANTEDKGKFRAPSLRNVAVTAPYNHDGSTATLEEVVMNYANGGRVIELPLDKAGDGRKNPNKSDLIVKIDLSPSEQADLVSFLRTLTDETVLTDPKYADPFQ